MRAGELEEGGHGDGGRMKVCQGDGESRLPLSCGGVTSCDDGKFNGEQGNSS